jgi:hypothetical protein
MGNQVFLRATLLPGLGFVHMRERKWVFGTVQKSSHFLLVVGPGLLWDSRIAAGSGLDGT